MTPIKVSFTGLEIDPIDLENRIHYGVIPQAWCRIRFPSDASLLQINRWLADHSEGRWAIFANYQTAQRQVTIAFELDYAGSMFILADGPNQCNASEIKYQ
jgi:hypothetical protein